MASPLKSSPASPSETETPQLECESPAGEESENHTMVVVKMESPEEEKENVPPWETLDIPESPNTRAARSVFENLPYRASGSERLMDSPPRKKSRCCEIDVNGEFRRPIPMELLFKLAWDEETVRFPPIGCDCGFVFYHSVSEYPKAAAIKIAQEKECPGSPNTWKDPRNQEENDCTSFREILGLQKTRVEHFTPNCRSGAMKSLIRAALYVILKHCYKGLQFSVFASYCHNR
ncbi:uncharacterized protein [Tiliqua scincoides]|uniref:uncharacterized protein n=1 Tax=Tiliqua scincoides TaxID=71010 RepID=UPI00346227DC